MDQHEMFTEVVGNVAKMCAVSAMTAPKSGGQLFLKGSKPFIETTIVSDKETLHRLAEWLRARGTKLKNPIFFRDADTAEKVDLILFIGLEKWYPPMYDCGACGYGTCNEFLRASPGHHTAESADWEFLGPRGRAFDERVPQEHFLRQENSESRFRGRTNAVNQSGWRSAFVLVGSAAGLMSHASTRWTARAA